MDEISSELNKTFMQSSFLRKSNFEGEKKGTEVNLKFKVMIEQGGGRVISLSKLK